MKRNKRKLAELLPKTERNMADRKRYSSETLKGIYGTGADNYYGFRLVESSFSDGFFFNLES